MYGSMISASRTPLPLLSKRHMEPVPTAVGNPWGLELTGLGFQAGGGVKVNRYFYNGKEILSDHNLNLYDYGARFSPSFGKSQIQEGGGIQTVNIERKKEIVNYVERIK